MSKNARSRMWSRWLSKKPAADLPARGLAVEALEDRLAPATFTWDGGGGNSLWTTAANWTGDIGPAQSADPVKDLVFPSTAARPANQNDLPTDTVINSITIQGQPTVAGVLTPYSISQAPDLAVNSIVLGNGTPSSGTFTVGANSGTVVFNLPTRLATNGDQSIFVGSGGSTLSVAAPLTASALNNLNKDGIGQLNLTAANTNLLGGVKVNQGVLQIRNVAALGPAGGTETVVGNGASLYLFNVAANAGQTTIGEQVRLNGGGFDTARGALFLESGDAVWAGPVILDIGVVSPPQAGGPGVVVGAGSDTLTGTIFSLNITGLVSDTGAGMGLVKEGLGEVKLGSTTGNTYRGQTNVNNGTLTITHSLSLGDSRIGSGATNTPVFGTIVNRSPGRNGQLRIEAPVGGPEVRVVGEYLELNSGGNDGFGALYNSRGQNTWAGNVMLGSPAPDGADVTIGVAGPLATTSLTVSGLVDDDSRVGTSLTKVQPGRLIFTNANDYRGVTNVVGGALAIRDSQGLGPAGIGGGTNVFVGAALELDVERAYSAALMPQFDDLGRNTWTDSITNDDQRLSVREPLTLRGRGTGANALGTGTTQFQSSGGTGALRSWTGINTWASTITLVSTGSSDEASIGVELDGSRQSISGVTNRPGHPLPDSSYFRDDYSLTVQDPTVAARIGIVGPRIVDFVKLGGGHLILPQANPYTGRTLIEQGWVTIQNNRSLGDSIAADNIGLGETALQPTIVSAGAALHITPTTPNVDLTILEKNIVIAGLGLGSQPLQEQHPYSYINQKGALMNLGGNNTVAGDVGFVNTNFGQPTERGAGIGVERAASVEFPAGSGSFVLLPSRLTITGDLSDGITYQQSFNNNTPGLNPANSRIYNVGATRGRISVPYSFGGTQDRLQIFYPDASSPANLIYDTGDVATGGAGPVIGVGYATVNFGSATSTGTTVQVVVSQSAAVVGWQVGVFTINQTPRGVVTQYPSSFVKLGSQTLALQGSGSHSGRKNEIREGTLVAQNDTAFGRATVGTEMTQQVYDVTETTVASGASLHLSGSVTPAQGGVAAGVHVLDERLTLNQWGIQIRIAGQPTARFQLDYAGEKTDVLEVPSGYTGTVPYAQYLQDQINTKLTGIAEDLVSGVPGATTADAQALVTELTPGVYVVTFGSARFNNIDPGDLKAIPAEINLPTITSLAELEITVLNAPLVGLSDDTTWRGPVTLGRDIPGNTPGTRIEVRANSRLQLLGDILDGVPSTAPGSDLVKRDSGDLTLGGVGSTYRGTTYIDGGIVTAVSSRAFGAASSGAADPVTGVTPGGTRVRSGAQIQIQGSLAIAGEALAVAGNGTPTLPTLDSTIRWLNVGPGATNNGVAPPYTGTNPGAPTSARIDSISTDPTDPRVIYIATAGGGAWKTKDGGLTWIPLFDIAVQPGTVGTNLPVGNPVDAAATGLPLSAMMFSGQIAVAPSDPNVVYYATGDSNAGFPGIPNTGQTNPYFTGAPDNPNSGQTDNYAGSGVYRSLDAGVTWTRLLDTGGTNPLYGQAVTKMIVDPLEARRVYVASSTRRTVPATPTSVNNGSTNPATQAGVWRFTDIVGNTDLWVNLVGQASARRTSTLGAAPFDTAAPANAGPEDDYRIRFPVGTANSATESATWSDIQLVTRGFHPSGNMQYTLYAALGESTQTYFTGPTPAGQAIRNAIYRTDRPELSIPLNTSPGPRWWLGRGTEDPIQAAPGTPYVATAVDLRGGEFDVGVIPPPTPANPPWPGKYGYIKIAVASTRDEQFNALGQRTEHALVTLYVAGLWRDPYRVDGGGNPVPTDPQRGELRELSRSVAVTLTSTAGTTYNTVTPPTNPFGTATNLNAFVQRPATGRYNFTFELRDFDPRTIGDNNPSELFLGGLDSLHRSVDGATSWQVVGADAAGFAPAEQHHALAFDTSNRLLVGTDGGLWAWDRLTFRNLNSNLPAIQFNSLDAHPTDFRQAVGGTPSSGTQVWNGNTTDGSTGVWARVDNLSTTPTVGQSGSVSGVVRYDPFNPNVLYAVRDGTIRKFGLNPANNQTEWFQLNPLLASLGVTGFTAGNTNSFLATSPLGYDLFPLVVDQLTPNRLLIGGLVNVNQPVFPQSIASRFMESTDGGLTWTNLNSGLLDALITPPGFPPIPFIPRVIAVAGYQGAFRADSRFPTVTEGLSNTPDPRTIYVSNGSSIAVTKNRGVSYVLAGFALPAGGTITDIVVNPVNRDELYVTVSVEPGVGGGRIWRSIDAGQTFQDITGAFDPDGIALNDFGPLPNIPTWKAAIDPRSGNLYVGNDNGVWLLTDANATDPNNVARTAVFGPGSVAHWRRVGDGMPNVQVKDLSINQTTSVLTAGTYGRGMFQMFLPDYAANSGAVRAVSGQSRWTGPVVLTGDTRVGAVGTQQIQNGLSAASIDFGGQISSLNNAPFELEKVGRGTVILSGSNTYTGVTDITEGVLEVKDPNALGAPTGNTVVRYGAALQVRSDIELEPITINGDGIPFSGHFTGALRNISGNNTYNGVLTLGTETQTPPILPVDAEPNQVTIGVDSGSSLKIGQNLLGQNPTAIGHVQGQTAAMGFNKELPGTLILSSENTNYLGLTQVYTGAVEVRDAQALGPVGGSQPTRVSDGAAVRIANNTDLPGLPTPTVVTTESLFLSGTGTPDGPGGSGTGALRNTGGNNTWNGPIQLTDIPNFAPTTNPGHQVAFGVSNPADVLTVGPTAGITEDYATFGQFGVIKVGTGVLRLTTANQYTGVTNINEGTLRAANSQALGATPPDSPAAPYLPSSEVQTIRVFGGGAAALGQYQLTVNGSPTATLSSNPAGVSSTAAQVQAAIEAVIAGTGATVFVSSTPNSNGNVYTVTFRGRFSGQNVPVLGFTGAAAGVSITIATPQQGGLGTVVAAGASLELDGSGLDVPETLTINGLGVTDPDGIRYGALGNRGGTNTYSGVVSFGSATSVGAQPGSDLVVTGSVLGRPNDPTPTTGPTARAAEELTKVGFGTVWFQGDKAYRGRTVVSEGGLQINSAGGLGVGRSEVQRLRVTGVIDTELFTLTFFGETTDAITLRAGQPGADAIKAALTIPRSGGLGPIMSVDDLDVTFDPTVVPPGVGEVGEAVFLVTFSTAGNTLGRYRNTNVPLLTDISPSTPQSTPANLVVSTELEGQPAGTGVGASEIQTFIIPNQGGTFTVAGVGTFPFNILLADLQTAFNGAAAPFGGGAGTPNTLLTETVLPGNTGRLITINFQNASANLNIAQTVGTVNPRLRVRVDGITDGVGSETQLIDVRNPVGLQYRLTYVNPLTGLTVVGTRNLGASATVAEYHSALHDPVSLGGLGIGTGLAVATTTPGAPGVNEVQTFAIPAQTGNFTVRGSRPTGAPFNGTPFVLGPYNFDVPLATLQADFNSPAAYGPGATVLTESVGPGGVRLITVRFQGTLSNVDVPQLTGSFSLNYLVTVTRTTSPGGLQYLLQFGGALANINLLPVSVTIVNGGANITVNSPQNVPSGFEAWQDGYEGTVVSAGGSLELFDLPAISSEWVTLNGQGRSEVQQFVATRTGAAAGTYTLRYTDPATGLPVVGTRVLTVGDAAGVTPSSSAAEFIAALTDPLALGGLGLPAGSVFVNRVVTGTGVSYDVRFTGALVGTDFAQLVGATPTGATTASATLEEGSRGALRMLDSTGNFTTVWGDPNNVSPLILGSNASIGVDDPSDVLRLTLPTTDRNPYSTPTTVLGPTNVRGPNQGLTLTKTGLGTLEFNAAGNNDYTGSTLVNNGTLLLNHTGAVPHDAVLGPLVIGDGIDAAGTAPAAALSQSAVVRLANSDQIANAPPVTVNADGLLDLHGWVETIGVLGINGGVVDTQTPVTPAFPVVPAGVSVVGPELTTGTVTMNDGQFIVRGGDQALTGAITATNTAEVIVDANGGLTSGAIDLTGSSLSVGANATADTQGNTITARRGPAPGSVRSTITTDTGATLTTVSGATRGAVTLTDSDLTTGTSSLTTIGTLTLNKDTTLPATGSTATIGSGATLNSGGADILVNESDLTTLTNAVINPTSPQGRLVATGTAADPSNVTLGAGTDANFSSATFNQATLAVGAAASLETTGTTAPNVGVTMTDTVSTFAADSVLQTAAGGLTMTRSTLTGTSGVDILTQAVQLLDNSTLSLGTGTLANPATINTNGADITVSASSLVTGATPDQTTPATINTGGGALNATGISTRRSVVDLGAGTTSTVGPVSLTLADLTTGTGATLTAGTVTAGSSTIATGANSVTNSGTVALTDSTLSFGAGSTNAVTGNLTTTDTAPLTATDGNVTFGAASATTVSGSVAATDAAVLLQDGAAVAAGPLALTNSTLTLDASAAVPHTAATVTTVTLTESTAALGTNAVLSASGTVSVLASANGSSTTGAGVFRLTGAAAQTVAVADGAADEDFTIASGLTQANGQTVLKTGPGRLTLAPTGTTLTTLLEIAAGDVQVDTLTGPVQVDAGGTLSGNGTTGAITVPSGASVGTVSPGDGYGIDRSGVLTANGNVVLGPTSTLFLNLIGNGSAGTGTQAPGTHYDQLFVNGNVTIQPGATLTGLVDTTTVQLSNRFVVVRATGTITGIFAELATSPGFVFVDGYKFDINYITDPSTGDSLVVLDKVKVITSTALTSTNDLNQSYGGSPSTLNQPVTFTATVSAEPGSRVPPPGTTFVQFFEETGVGGRMAISGPVAISASGMASFTISNLSAGTHTITADYLGDAANFAQSTSNPLTQIVEQPAVSITGASPTPAPLSPNNPTSVGFNDTLTLNVSVTRERSAYTPSLRVTGPSGVVFLQVLTPTTTPATTPFPGFTVGRNVPASALTIPTTTFNVTWDGTRNVSGTGFVADGDYQVEVIATDERGNNFSSASVTVRVDNTSPTGAGNVDAPVIRPGNATPPPPATTTFSGTITDDNLGTWTVTVRDASNAVVRTFNGTGPTVTATWDGTDAANAPVVDGRYTLTLVATDAGGNTNTLTSPVVRTVYVVRTAPAVTLLTGLGTAVGPTTYGDTVTLTAVVALPAFVLAADANTFLSTKPVTFDFPGTGTLTSNIVFNASANRYEARADVPLNLAAGTYSPITATFLATAELPQATATGSHTVNRAQLRVTGVNATRPYAEANPDFDFVVNTADLKFTDTAAVASGEPTTAAVVASNAGTYDITRGTVTALPNYDVVFTNGTLTVTPVALTIRVADATRARFASDPPFTATFEGFKLSDGPAAVSNLNLVTSATKNSPIGAYPIFSGTLPTATNYAPIVVVNGTLTVTGSPNVTVVGSGAGSADQAQVLSPSGEKLQNIGFTPSFGGGIRTATGDFNKDGVADFVTGTGPGQQAAVQIIDGATGDTLFLAKPFEDFAGGVFVAAGDMTGDGIAELVVTPDEGGGPRVVIYRGGDFAQIVSYLAIDDANFRGGVRPAVGDFDGDGFADLAVSAGFGGGPRISLWDGEELGKLEFKNMIPDFFAFEQGLRNGAFVSVGDVNGDGQSDLIVGAGPGGGPRVKIYDGKTLLSVGGDSATVFANFFAGNENNRGGVKVAAKNLDGDKFIDLVTGGGAGDRAVATAYRGSALAVDSPAALYEFDLDGSLNGVFVG